MRRVLFIFCAAAIGLLGGCQQIAWKPGASAADLDRDTAACREQFAEEPAMQNCLRQRGWVLRQPPAAKGADAETQTDADDTTVAAEANSAAPGSTPAPTASTTTSASTPAAGDKLASTPVQPAAAKPVAAKAKAIDPMMAKTLIQSWWKVGAQAADLSADQDACVETLGAAHRPDLKNRLYTHAMIDCLHAHGWSGH